MRVWPATWTGSMGSRQDRPVQVRLEDRRFLTGGGKYLDDLDPPELCHGAFARMPVAHARIRSIDVADAESAPGVICVLTAETLRQEGAAWIPLELRPPGPAGSDPNWHPPTEPVLADDRSRFVGEPVAFVVAETVGQAQDAAELVHIEYEELASVTDVTAAVDSDIVLHDAFPGNVLFTHECGNLDAVEAEFAKAAHRFRLGTANQRVYAAALEPRGCIGEFDAAAERYTLRVGSPRPHNLQRALADHVFKVPRNQVRIVATDIGGGFGSKNGLYPENITCLFAARRLGRPVKWVADRGEGLTTDNHGRDSAFTAEIAVGDAGDIRAIKVERLVNLGAYTSPRTMVPTFTGLAHVTGVYDVPAAWIGVRGVVTNTSCTSVYRGAGRPEAVTLCERLIDYAARELGIDPIEFRRRNIMRPESLPATTALGMTYPQLDFQAVLELALERADHAHFDERRQRSEANGRYRGFGVSLFVEELHGSPEPAPAAIFLDGETICIAVATMASGHGHETTFVQIAAEQMGLPVDRFRLVQGDTAIIPDGIGTAASWSTILGGSSVHLAAKSAIERGKTIAAKLLEAADEDIEFRNGQFGIAGTDRSATWQEVFASDPAFRVDAVHDDLGQAFPIGCHACEVEVDAATGTVEIDRYTVVQDAGRVINPLVVVGQLQGGVAQGIGQAWCESVIYESESGQVLTGSFMDYAVPRATDLPAIDVTVEETPDPVNPLGVKGIGEAGTTGSAAAFVNSVVDALSSLGIHHIEMPLAPHRIWSAIRDAAGSAEGRTN